MEFTEHDILQGFINRDTRILNHIYDEYFPPIRYHIIHNSGHPADAMEVFQASMVITYDKLRKKQFTLSCNLNTYIQAICRNLWLKELRQRGKSITYSLDVHDEINIAYEENSETVDTEEIKVYLYQKHFIALGKSCKRLLRLQINNESFKSIAKKMGYASENIARKKRYRCIKKLISLIMSDPEYNKLKDNED